MLLRLCHYTTCLLSQEYVEKEVFVIPKLSTKEVKKPTGCLWAVNETPKGQQLLTIWDTGAVVSVAPTPTPEDGFSQ